MRRNKLNKIWNLIEQIKDNINLPIISDFLEWFYEKLYLNFYKNIPLLNLSKWDIFFINLWKNVWSELNKNRPCLIISKALFNKTNTVIVIPLKSYKWKLNRNTQLLIKYKLLKSKSIVDCLSIRQVDKRRIHNYVWKLNKSDLARVDKKIAKIFWIKNK